MHNPFTIYFPPPSTTDPFTRRRYLSALCQSLCISFPFALSFCSTYTHSLTLTNCCLTPSTARVILPLRPADPRSIITRLSTPHQETRPDQKHDTLLLGSVYIRTPPRKPDRSSEPRAQRLSYTRARLPSYVNGSRLRLPALQRQQPHYCSAPRGRVTQPFGLALIFEPGWPFIISAGPLHTRSSSQDHAGLYAPVTTLFDEPSHNPHGHEHHVSRHLAIVACHL
jgi:hypothetical protein